MLWGFGPVLVGPPELCGGGGQKRVWNEMGHVWHHAAAAALCVSVSHLPAPRMRMPAASAGILYAVPTCGLV